jgi:DNA polymerase III delta subunit
MDAVGNKLTDQAVRLLHETLEAGGKPEEAVMRVVPMLARHFRMLYQAVFLKEAGIRNPASAPEDIREMMPKDHNLLTAGDWTQKQLTAQARFFTEAQVRACLKQVLACELATKGIEGDSTSRRLHLEMLVVRLCERR